MRYTPNYPDTVEEVLRDRKYNPDVLRALKQFRRSKPFRGTYQERKEKFKTLFEALKGIYGKTGLTLHLPKSESADCGNGSYSHFTQEIKLYGRLSVITFLHEFAHALGKDEKYACIWSVNLFKRIFPKSFERCSFDGHMVRRGTSASAS